jgi:serine/threonine protein kinase
MGIIGSHDDTTSKRWGHQVKRREIGEVYQARDTRLNRIVAVEVSSQRFSERFEREARVIASLNHPNICTLYDVGPGSIQIRHDKGGVPC